MPLDQHVDESEIRNQGTVVGEGVARNGIDGSSARRAHMRELTMARQAAERRFARPGISMTTDRPARLAAARERAEELRQELARIDDMHRAWLQAQGVHVPDRLARQGRLAPSELLAPARLDVEAAI
ncbi:MAG TPA: hypothetical protein VNL71_06705 [Chloroflexota bacterium]|nr:hypothetical protein [Chloroflexota bacterium]